MPLIARWPNGKVPAGQVCSIPVVNHDFYPTSSKQPASNPIPCKSWTGFPPCYLEKPECRSCAKPFIGITHSTSLISSAGFRRLHTRRGSKFISAYDPARPEKFELFDLKRDPSEKKDLALSKPKRVKELHRKLVAWRERTGPHSLLPLADFPPQSSFRGAFLERTSQRQMVSKRVGSGEWHPSTKPDCRSEQAALLQGTPFQRRLDPVRIPVRRSRGHPIGNGCVRKLQHGLARSAGSLLPPHSEDARGPWFSMRHSECAYDFKPDKWYVMTMEFIGDQVVAHLDHEHLVYANT